MNKQKEALQQIAQLANDAANLEETPVAQPENNTAQSEKNTAFQAALLEYSQAVTAGVEKLASAMNTYFESESNNKTNEGNENIGTTKTSGVHPSNL